MDDYWLELKYFISGLKLLVEMSYMMPGNREMILERWFIEKDNDPLRNKMRNIVERGMRQEWDVRYIVESLIREVPKEEWYKMDRHGYTFLPCNPENPVEQIYSNERHKNIFRSVYEGLYPGVDEFGQSLADLKYEKKSSGAVRILEDYADIGSMRLWANVVLAQNDEELATLATGMSRRGIFLILAGIEHERVPNVAMKTVLNGPEIHKDSQKIAQIMYEKWIEDSNTVVAAY